MLNFFASRNRTWNRAKWTMTFERCYNMLQWHPDLFLSFENGLNLPGFVASILGFTHLYTHFTRSTRSTHCRTGLGPPSAADRPEDAVPKYQGRFARVSHLVWKNCQKRRNSHCLAMWIAVSWAPETWGENSPSLHKRGSCTVWVANRLSFLYVMFDCISSSLKIAIFSNSWWVCHACIICSYPHTFVCWCAAVQQEFLRCRPEDGTGSIDTRQDERLLYQTWITQFFEQYVLQSEWERERESILK